MRPIACSVSVGRVADDGWGLKGIGGMSQTMAASCLEEGDHRAWDRARCRLDAPNSRGVGANVNSTFIRQDPAAMGRWAASIRSIVSRLDDRGTGVLCEPRCHNTRNGVAIYNDDDHLGATGSPILSGSFADAIGIAARG